MNYNNTYKMSTNFNDDHDENEENNKKMAIIDAIYERLEVWKNPAEITIGANVDEKFRNDFYEKMNKMERNKVLSMFVKCGGIKSNKYDFVTVNEKKRKREIEKMEKKIEELQSSLT
jgi:hypothetical protein